MSLKLDDFLYDLPEEKIAKHPPENRFDSKLLFYNKGAISHHKFREITKIIPRDTLIIFNDTKVIPARIIMHKETGGRIEIFLLEPLRPSIVHEEVMNASKTCTWKCLIGNAKKWKVGTSLINTEVDLKATRLTEDTIQFEWNTNTSFSDILVAIGKIPLPPYIDREVEAEDNDRYQTVYSKMKGAVAAPTAGLHFTDEIISDLEGNGVKTDYLTLHVSAGTFQPIKEQNIYAHPMHNEQIWITKDNIENILSQNNIIAVGTTVMRTIESVYWFGAKLLAGRSDFFIQKKDPYSLTAVSKESSLNAVLSYMNERNVSKIGGHTEIFIYPGYEFKICKGLITNYHLPGSTLILLVAAFLGSDWRDVYNEALQNNYRFLSYGDSSLLIP